jgi:hypothetical protein
LNLLGNDNITFSGTNFPHDVATSTFELKFSNGLESPCLIQSSSTNEFVCLTTIFDRIISLGQTYDLSVVINGQTVENTKKFTMMSGIAASKDLNPSSASPVLKTPISITLGEEFPEDLQLNPEDFSVNATSTLNEDYVRYLNVLSVD